MKIQLLFASLCAGSALLLLSGCNNSSASSSSSNGPASSAASAPSGKVHTVSMRGTAEGFFFEPKQVNISRGDTVRFVLVDGAPHNVSFTDQQIPANAKMIFENQGKLVGAMLQAPQQSYALTFTKELPAGEYNFVCDPHAPLGMKGKIVVSP